jgi:hypothetical protein
MCLSTKCMLAHSLAFMLLLPASATPSKHDRLCVCLHARRCRSAAALRNQLQTGAPA